MAMRSGLAKEILKHRPRASRARGFIAPSQLRLEFRKLADIGGYGQHRQELRFSGNPICDGKHAADQTYGCRLRRAGIPGVLTETAQQRRFL